MVSDNALTDATIWVLSGFVVVALGNFVGSLFVELPIIGKLLFAAIWLAAHFYGIRLGLIGVSILIDDAVEGQSTPSKS
ncbi:GNAT family protein [Halorussus halophilus]|uniref:hypothetical protein n=1 Tax=Halorussus halophilus TaxID=2650975 RepID=UPI001300CDE1|nr:hypothetical protein [Halorussus halophilus]